MAKESIAKYTHYYERWADNHSSRVKAVEDLKKVQSVHNQILSKQGKTQLELQCITDAWKQIIECRRVLKWTYAYGYYLPEYEKTKKRLFEFLQGQAENELERLHGCGEKELQPYLDPINPLEDFNDFRKKIDRLTKDTKNHFENLVRGLENGLSEVDCERERAIEEYKREGRKYGFYNSDDEDEEFEVD
ncbi:probable E3 ubiquitin-protein ligase ARI8 [Papaver somniferum]|uniref:probable E3 ubiquitin-protein ligase ARI8 n=1 Tax=Papaver somniferum TaxID=3469 RepID=UPI000E6F89F6|nr:probable E3 ubiquitin-protein ligase ARI8 [Papaver somniferum]